jgi:hypothetical protein
MAGYIGSKAVILSTTGADISGNVVLSGTVDGRDVSVDGTKLDGIDTAAKDDQTAAEILTAVKTVDGAASGLDADLLDGQHGAYYTAYADTAVTNLVDNSPAALNTLNELAAALGDDASFSTTVTNSIAAKLPLAGGAVTGNVTFGDNNKAIFGAGSDLQIYHNSANNKSYIEESGSGNLVIRGSDIDILAGNGEAAINVAQDGAVTLYHDNAAKIATTSTGIDVTGTAVTDGLTVAGNVSVDGGTIKLDGNYPVGTENVALGNAALDSLTSGRQNTALGPNALTANTTGNVNTAVGYRALLSNTTGYENTAIGPNSLKVNTTGLYNTAVGSTALFSNTTASNNTAVGYRALHSATTGGTNTAVGHNAGYNNTTATRNTLVGQIAGYSLTTGAGNVVVGDNALKTSAVSSNSVSIGTYSLAETTTGTFNTAIGSASGEKITTGSKNTILGRYNGNQGGLDIRTASNNIVLSDGDGNPRVVVDSTGAVSIGAAASPYGSTRLYLGNGASGNALFQANNTHNVSGDVLQQSWLGSNCSNTSSYFLLCGVVGVANRMYVYGNGNIVNTNNSYGALSDVKLKENIVDASSQWDDIKALTVRKYSMKEDNLDAPNMLGVIAQEVEDAGMGGLVFESPDRDTDNNVLDTTTKHVSYSILYMKAVKALQEAMTRIEALETKVTALEDV